MNKTEIEYLDYSWNPIAMRCTPVSPGCAHCWHLRMADRMCKNPNFPPEVRAAYAGEGPPVLIESRLQEPLKRKKASRIGVQFMGDLFHSYIPLAYQAAVLKVIHECPQHTFLILTKRTDQIFDHACGFPMDKNIWLGVSVENQATANERIPVLQQIPAALRWVSVEPMLSAVDLTRIEIGIRYPSGGGRPLPWTESALEYRWIFTDEGDAEFHKIDWVVCGGESGPGVHPRPMHPTWPEHLLHQCRAADIPFFFKQWGSWLPHINYGDCAPADKWTQDQLNQYPGAYLTDAGKIVNRWTDAPSSSTHYMYRVGKKAAGHLLEGKVWNQVPERKGDR